VRIPVADSEASTEEANRSAKGSHGKWARKRIVPGERREFAQELRKWRGYGLPIAAIHNSQFTIPHFPGRATI
jgi:hypothetical protein